MPSKSKKGRKSVSEKVKDIVQGAGDADENGEKQQEVTPGDEKVESKAKPKTDLPKFRGYVELESDQESLPEKNVFHETLQDGKRKRSVSIVEAVLNDWMSAHLIVKTGVHLSVPALYEEYVDCALDHGGQVTNEVEFKRALTRRFPEGFTIQEDSPFYGKVKEAKQATRRKKVQGETLKMKIKDIIQIVLKELGNPQDGVKFHKILKLASVKYPAHNFLLRPKKLLYPIEQGCSYGKYVCTKGIGKCGYYKLPSKDEDEQQEITEKEPEEAGEESKVPPKKRKIQTEEDDNQDADGDKKTLSDTSEKKAEERKQTIKKKSPGQIAMHKISHSNPRVVEHVFPMAFTFQSDPKEASIKKIKTYILGYYPKIYSDNKIMKQLEDGENRGYWERVSGKGASGTMRLTVDEWNPSYDDDLLDIIINAIIACHEPKQCTASFVRKYIEEFHPNFKIDSRPVKFKKAVERAVSGGLIRQLTGIGLSGTFELVKPFEPSPANLAGEDSDCDASSEESLDESSDESSSSEEEVRRPKSKIYISKSRGGRLRDKRKVAYYSSDSYSDEHNPKASTARYGKRKSPRKVEKKTKRQQPSSESEDSSESDEERNIQKSKSSRTNKQNRGLATATVKLEPDTDSEAEIQFKSTPKASNTGRGRSSKNSSQKNRDEEMSKLKIADRKARVAARNKRR